MCQIGKTGPPALLGLPQPFYSGCLFDESLQGFSGHEEGPSRVMDRAIKCVHRVTHWRPTQHFIVHTNFKTLPVFFVLFWTSAQHMQTTLGPTCKSQAVLGRHSLQMTA
jgi:hypothetical protein